jgi:hypothetical protein
MHLAGWSASRAVTGNLTADGAERLNQLGTAYPDELRNLALTLEQLVAQRTAKTTTCRRSREPAPAASAVH